MISRLDGAAAALVPRKWQEEALETWARTGRGVLSVVTGAGKTAFALLAHARGRASQDDLRLVVIVPTLALLDQWMVVLKTDGGFGAEEVAVFSGESRSSAPGRANVLVINTARDAAKLFDDGVPTMLVVDECHRAGSPENARALAVRADMTLGLSATPVRDFDDGFERFVEPALGPIIYEYDYAAARADGVISPFALHNFRFELSTAEASSYQKLTRQIARQMRLSEGEDDLQLKRLLLARARVSVDSPRRNAATVATSERFAKPMLIFHERIASADIITGLLDRRGHRVATYHSKLGASIRRRNLERFRLNEVDLLVTCRALDEGLNVPNASSAVVGASTRSTRQRIQRLGRVLRATPDKDFAAVATVYATESERDVLEREASDLSDVAAIHWYEVDL